MNAEPEALNKKSSMAKKKTSATRLILILLGVVIVLVGAGAGLKAAGVFGSDEKGTVVEIDKSEVRSITQVVTASGRVQPEIEVSISPDVPGEIIALPVKEGDKVERGALLARIRPDDYKAQVERGEATVLQSKAMRAQRKADLLNAELELKRQADLFTKQAISESEHQRAETQFEVARAAHEAADYAVQSSEAQLREYQEQLAKTIIYAPMSGTISMLLVELGERVAGTSQMAGTEMMRVAQLDKMEIEVDVNENDVVNVSIGDSSAIEIDAYPGRSFKGIVTEIANSARVSAAGTQEQVTNFPVKIQIRSDADDLTSITRPVATSDLQEMPSRLRTLRPGMSAADAHAILTEGLKSRGANPCEGRLGHGLGLTLTEWPSFTPKDGTELREGMVLTLEPSAQTGPGRMLVHEENIVLRANGPELLSRRAPRDLPVIMP